MEEFHNQNKQTEDNTINQEDKRTQGHSRENRITDRENRTSDRRSENPGRDRRSESRTTSDQRSEDFTTDRDENRTSESGMLTGMFRDRESTENAYNTLHERGYSKDDINLIMSEETRKTHFADNVKETEIGNKAAEGAGKGSAIGGTVGAIAGVIAAIGTSLVIPGLGIIIAGPIAIGLAGAGAGGLTGGIIGALIGSGIPEARAKLYESGIKDGQIVLGVNPRTDEDAKYFEDNWRSNKGEEIHR